MPKADVLNKMIKHLKGFDAIARQVKIIKANKGNCVASLKLGHEHLNTIGGLHVGCSATLVDTVSGMGLITLDKWETPSVSLNINLVYMKGAKLGDEITIHSKVMHAGKAMVFLDVELRNAANQLLVKAEHTKYKVPC